MNKLTHSLTHYYKIVSRSPERKVCALETTCKWQQEQPGRIVKSLDNKSSHDERSCRQILAERYCLTYFVGCTEEGIRELEERLATASTASVAKDQARHTYKTYTEEDIDLLIWLSKSNTPFYFKKAPLAAKPAEVDIPGFGSRKGLARKVQKKDVDYFYFTILDDEHLAIEIAKGEAKLLTDAEKLEQFITHFEGKRWYVLQRLYKKEMLMEEALNEWAAMQGDLELTTFLPTDKKDLSDEQVQTIRKKYPIDNYERRKRLERLVFSGYLFVQAGSDFLLQLAGGKVQAYPGIHLFAHLMKQKGLPRVVPDKMMDNFKKALQEETLDLELKEGDIQENMYAVFRGTPERMHLKGCLGRVQRHRGKLYFTLSPLPGLMATCKGFPVKRTDIRPPRKAELEEMGMGKDI